MKSQLAGRRAWASGVKLLSVAAVWGVLISPGGWAAQIADPQNPQELENFEGKTLLIPGIDLRLFCGRHDGEAVGFNADGTAVATNRKLPLVGQQPRYNLTQLMGDRYVFVDGGGRTLNSNEYAWSAGLLTGNPTRGMMIGRCGHGGPGAGLWEDLDPFNWSDDLGLFGTHFHHDLGPGVFFGESAPGEYFGKAGGLAYVGDGIEGSRAPEFEGCYRGTEFGTGLLVGIDLEGPLSQPRAVYLDSLRGDVIFVPGANEAIDVATIDARDVFTNARAIIIGTRHDLKPGAWEVTRDGKIRNLRMSGPALEEETSLLYPVPRAPFARGWDYFPQAISRDGMVIVGYADMVHQCNFYEGPIAVLWQVLGAEDGRVVMSEAIPLATPTYNGRDISGVHRGLVKAFDVFFDAENQLYVISGTDHNGKIALATLPVESLVF